MLKKLVKTKKPELIYPPDPPNPTWCAKLKVKLLRSTLINEEHPQTLRYFRSELAILREKRRQHENFKNVIHPLSKFKQIYDLWCFFLYGSLLFMKLFDWGFLRVNVEELLQLNGDVNLCLLILDGLHLITMIVEFFQGYFDVKTHTIVLSKREIAKRYFKSGHFFCDLLSSIPRLAYSHYLIPDNVYLFFNTCALLKLRRFPTFISLLYPTAQYFNIKSHRNIFLFGLYFVMCLVMHTMTCSHMGITRYRFIMMEEHHPDSWLQTDYVFNVPLRIQYLQTFFRNAQYTLLISVGSTNVKYILPEEVGVAILNYVVGKLLIGAMWIVLLYLITSRKTLSIKYQEVMSELNEYIRFKRLPDDLRKRLISYYTYKYQQLFFNEKLIRSVLSDNLKREIDLFLCKSIKHVELFNYMRSSQIKQVISYLVPEIHLPNDTIIQSGNVGDCMYFLDSGTVAVFTPSGREVCHLQDGAYFGEIAIIIKNQKRTATVMAIEITRLYKLKKVHFDKCFELNTPVFNYLVKEAEHRTEQTEQVDKDYKKYLFEKTYKYSINSEKFEN